MCNKLTKSTPVCGQGCVQGKCTNHGCICEWGWTGDSCDTLIQSILVCTQDCFHGTCVASNQCKCKLGWSGNSCDTGKKTLIKALWWEFLNFQITYQFLLFFQAVCNQGCQHGKCIAPNHCSCNNGWTGFSCETKLSSEPYHGHSTKDETTHKPLFQDTTASTTTISYKLSIEYHLESDKFQNKSKDSYHTPNQSDYEPRDLYHEPLEFDHEPKDPYHGPPNSQNESKDSYYDHEKDKTTHKPYYQETTASTTTPIYKPSFIFSYESHESHHEPKDSYHTPSILDYKQEDPKHSHYEPHKPDHEPKDFYHDHDQSTKDKTIHKLYHSDIIAATTTTTYKPSLEHNHESHKSHNLPSKSDYEQEEAIYKPPSGYDAKSPESHYDKNHSSKDITTTHIPYYHSTTASTNASTYKPFYAYGRSHEGNYDTTTTKPPHTYGPTKPKPGNYSWNFPYQVSFYKSYFLNFIRISKKKKFSNETGILEFKYKF